MNVSNNSLKAANKALNMLRVEVIISLQYLQLNFYQGRPISNAVIFYMNSFYAVHADGFCG